MVGLELVMFVPVLLGFLIPYITELVLGSNWDPRVKSVVNIALSLLLGVLGTVPVATDAAGLLPYFVNVLGAWLLSGRLYVAELVKGRVSADVTRRQDQL